jgi:hypothetical protein
MINIDRGQHLTGRHKLSEALNMPPHLVRSRLQMLSDEGMIQVNSTSRFSLITVCNYNTYQERFTEKDQPEASPTPAGSQPEATNKNDKNVKNDKNKRTRFQKPAVENIKKYLAEHKIYGIDPEQFWNYYEARGWMLNKTPMKSWESCVQTWRKRIKDNPETVDKQADAQRQKELDRWYDDYKTQEGIE